MQTVPLLPSILFISITIITLILFYLATNKNKSVLVIVLAIGSAQALLSHNGFFLIDNTFPPRLFLIIAPSVLLILYSFFSVKGKAFINSIDLERYTYLNTVRVVVEVGLFLLFIQKLVPESMTFEGRNFDVLSGITAPFIAYFGFTKKAIDKSILLAWNVICLVLVVQVVITGVLSAPSAIQQLAFDQPNVAVLLFPFVWLPGIIVPIVIFGHAVSIYRLKTELK